MQRTLGKEPEAWNDIARDDKARSRVERDYERFLTRDAMAALSGNEFKVLSFIKSRTLGWQKYAEAIPYRHFTEGLVDEKGEPARDRDGKPMCTGVGIAKEETVQRIVKGLVAKGLLTVFKGVRGHAAPANVYLPMHQDVLAGLIVNGDGVLPSCYPKWRQHEHVRCGSDHVVRLEFFNKDGVQVSQMRGFDAPSKTLMNFDVSQCSRFSVEDWIKYKKRH